MNLKNLSDKTLLNDTKKLVLDERVCITKVLHHFKEIESRRVFADLKYGSLFEYAVKELGYSEAAANRRIHSARLLKEFPELDKKFESNELNLTNATLAGQLFKNEGIKDKDKKRKILKRVENKTRKEAEKILFEFATPKTPPKEQVKRVSTDSHSITITISEKTFEKFKNLKRLLSNKNLTQDQLLDLMITITTEKVETAPAQSKVKTLVKVRDGLKCSNCKSNYKLNFDHIHPRSMGGLNTEKNLRLLCFSCNQRQRITNGLRAPP